MDKGPEAGPSRKNTMIIAPPKAPTATKSASTAVLLSALVYPGTGQLSQGRWVVGGLVMVSFTATSIWFAVKVVRVLTAYYELGFHFDQAQGTTVNPLQMLVPFAVSMALYLLGLVDTVIANLRRLRTPPR